MAKHRKQTPAQDGAAQTLVLPVVVLVVICLVCSVILALLNDVTAPIIEENTRAETLEAYLEVLPDGTAAEDMTEDDVIETENVEGAVTTDEGDVAVKAAASGYSGNDVTVYVSFDGDGVISKIIIDASTQTSGIGTKVADSDYADQYLGLDADDGAVAVDGVAGATYSSKAALAAVQAAVDYYNNEVKGGA